jgi:hypothetical protein
MFSIYCTSVNTGACMIDSSNTGFIEQISINMIVSLHVIYCRSVVYDTLFTLYTCNSMDHVEIYTKTRFGRTQRFNIPRQ